jgi:hypothetical protein
MHLEWTALSGLGVCQPMPPNPNCAGICPPGYCWTGHCDTTRMPPAAICAPDVTATAASALAPAPAAASASGGCPSGQVLIGGVCTSPLVSVEGGDATGAAAGPLSQITTTSPALPGTAASQPLGPFSQLPGWVWVAVGVGVVLLLKKK